LEQQWAKHAGRHSPQNQARETYFSSNVHPEVQLHDETRTGNNYQDNEPLPLVVRIHDQLGFLVGNQVDIGHLGLNDEDVLANGARRGNGSRVVHVSAVPDGDKVEKGNFEPRSV